MSTGDNPFYSHSAIVGRPKLRLPRGKRVAVWVAINIEHYRYGVPAISLAPFTSELVPDPLNTGWRDYGPRVGIWRLLDVFERSGVPPTAVLNSEVCQHYPEIVAEGRKRGWCWVAHGANNSTWQSGMELEEERAYIRQVTNDIESATGVRPKGWLGPVLTATDHTYDLLIELGYRYTLDWGIDDEPIPLKLSSGSLYAVPYSAELNDLPFFVIHGASATEFADALVDQFEQLLEEGEDRPRVMGIGLHPFLSGQPFRARRLEQALKHIASCENAWLTTSDEIAILGRIEDRA